MRLNLTRWLLTVTIALLGILVAERPDWARAQQFPAAATADDEGVETLLRGPLHEAFAEPISMDAQSGLIVPKKPPESIEEIPPDAKPADENVIWIPGYWAWDEDRDDFIYVSGVWRVPPQDHRWVPGYWTETNGGFQWVSGFWTPAETEEIRYLPSPPTSLEIGPTSPQPSSDQSWVSGCWLYRDSRYAWRSGYWNTYQDGWVWVPAHYVWTPHGVVFVAGYWDYPFTSRGVAFAPVCFTRPVYVRSGYCYSPSVVVDLSRVLVHLFVSPRHGHYYWGDYYGYRPHGGHHFYPCHDYHGRHGYDPVFAYYSANYRRHNIDYTQRLRGWHDYFQRHEECRPARTLEAQVRLAALVERREPELKYALLGSSLKDAISRTDGGVRLERISETHRQAWRGLSSQMHELTRQRGTLEAGHDFKPRFNGSAKTEPAAKTDSHRPDDRLRLPELPQIAKVKSMPGAPERLEDRRRVELPKDPNVGRSPTWRGDLGLTERSPHDEIRRPEASRSSSLPNAIRDTERLRKPSVKPPENHRPRIELPNRPTVPDVARSRDQDVKPPENRNPRIEIPGRAGVPDLGKLRAPNAKNPESHRMRSEVPDRPKFPDVAKVQGLDVKSPENREPRIEIPGRAGVPDFGRLRKPEVMPPRDQNARIEIQELPRGTSSGSSWIRGLDRRGSVGPGIPPLGDSNPQRQPRQMPQSGRSAGTERADRSAGRPELNRPEVPRTNRDSPPGGHDLPKASGRKK